MSLPCSPARAARRSTAYAKRTESRNVCHSVRTHALLLTTSLFVSGCLPERNHGGGRVEVEVTALSPDHGPRTGGNVVRIEGIGFGAEPFVTFGASNVETFVLVTDDAVEFLAPADNVGRASVTVTNGKGGRVTLVDAYFYEPLPAIAYQRRFFADSPDEAGANPVLVLSTAQAVGQLDVDVPRADAGAIEGVLTDDLGAPLAGHDVLAVNPSDGATVATLTRLDGSYRIEGLVQGTWTIRSDEAAGSPFADAAYPGVPNSLDADPIEVVAGSTATGIDFALEPGGTIRGMVTGGGAAIANAIVRADPVAANPLQFAYAVTDETGAFEMTGLGEGDYRVSASAFGSGRVAEYFPGALDAAGATPIAVTPGSDATADFDLDAGGSLAGEITEDSPSPGPLSGTLVVAHGIGSGLTFATATAGDGSWQLGELPPGDYLVEAPELGQWFAGVYSTAGATVVTVVAGAQETDVSFLGRLGFAPCGDPANTGTVSGEVTTGGGDPLMRVSVVLLPTSGGGVAFATSGRDGAWTADCVVPGIYTVRVTPVNTDLLAVDAATGLTVDTGAVTGVDSALPPGATLSGTVRDAQTNAPLASVPVRVRNPATGASRIVQTGATGQWAADRTSAGGIAPGSWRVEALPHVVSEHSPY